MNKKKKHSRLRLKIAITIALGFVLLIVGIFTYINDPWLQSKIFNSINKVSSLNIENAELTLNIIKRDITVKNIVLFNPEKDQRFMAESLYINFRLLPLIRGNLKIARLDVENPRIIIGESIEREEKKPPKIGLANLLLLENLTIQKGTINNITIHTPKSDISAKAITLSFIQSMWRDINLHLKISSPKLIPASGEPLTIEEIVINGRTDVRKWIDIFPYVDDLSGNVKLSNFKWKKLTIETFESRLEYSGKKIKISDSDLMINGDRIELKGKIDSNSEKYSLDINIPEGIYLPSFARESSFIDTSGNFKGKIDIKGKGLNYKTTSATANIDISQTVGAEDPLPANLKSELGVAGGKISIKSGTLKVGENFVSLHGDFNYLTPTMNLSFEGEGISVETVMNRFKEDNYHPTKGIAKVKGTFTGWKPNLKFHLSVEASPASYYEIQVDRVKLDLDVTYNNLAMVGELYQGDHKSGTVNLKMQMGKKLADGSRHRTYVLSANVTDADLTEAMKAYELTGTGNGTLNLKGVNRSFNGTGKIKIKDGGIKGVSFTSASSDMQLNRQKIVFNNAIFATSETNPVTFQTPIVMDLSDNGFRLRGSPRDGVAIDARYFKATESWRIDKLVYSSPKNPSWETRLTGTVGKNGELNLKIAGTLDASLLSYLRGSFREASGPIELGNVHLGGTTENVSATGKVVLNDNAVQLRNWGYYFDKINGVVLLKGRSISTDKLVGRIEYGDFILSGSVNHTNNSVSHADMDFEGKSIMYATRDKSFRMEFDCKMDFRGSPSSSMLAGNISIIDGKYTKKFSVFESLKRTKKIYKASSPDEIAWKNMRLNLKVKTNGDLKIDNNIGEIWLNADLQITGLENKPNVSGNIEALGGEIHYAGLDFEVTRGYVEFRAPYSDPFIEFVTAKEVGRYNVTLTVRGDVDKLYVDLDSTPPLDKKDILALLTYGVTQEDLKDVRFGYQVGTGLVAEQIGAVLQKPITKFTPLDHFRVEAAPRTTSGASVTRLHMGKDISDRLSINFITDINTEDAQQTFQAEYLMTDFMLLKGARVSNHGYRFHLSFRFRE